MAVPLFACVVKAVIAILKLSGYFAVQIPAIISWKEIFCNKHETEVDTGLSVMLMLKILGLYNQTKPAFKLKMKQQSCNLIMKIVNMNNVQWVLTVS